MTSRTVLDFDELNKLGVKVKKIPSTPTPTPTPIPYRQYFGEMYISPEQMRSRISLAEEIEDVMLYLLAYWTIAEVAEISIDEVKQDAEQRLTAVVAKHMVLDPYLEKHINDVINEVVDVTERQEAERKRRKEEEESGEEDDIEKFLEEDSNERPKDYWTSRDRAMLISENEANAFENYNDFREAKAQGKRKKTWVTEGDERVRMSHLLMEEKTIDIDGLFLVGNSKMRFPRDAEYDAAPNEVVNCRCVCEYT